MLTASELRAGMAVRVEGTLYKDDRLSCVMRPETFEQIEIEHARLENGLTLMVPPFIAPGELVGVDVERGAYVERAKVEEKK